MYASCMGGPTKKARLNLTIDPDIYRASRRAFNVLDMNMSAFVEQQLAVFLQVLKPFDTVMDQAERGEIDPATLKSAMRAFNASGAELVGDSLIQFGKIQREMAELAEGHTDKK